MTEKVYITLNQKIFDWLRDKRTHPEKNFKSTVGILNSFNEIIGDDYLRLLTPSEIFDPRSKRPANIYKLNRDSYSIEPVGETFETPILVMIDENGFLPNFSMQEIERQHRFYRDMMSQGRIGHMINTPDSKETNDKKLLPELFGNYNPPEQFNFSKPDQLIDLVNAVGSVVVKHRFGSDGENFYITTLENVSYVNSVIASRMGEFVYQPFVPIDAESRLVVIDGEVVGSRIFEDRYKPGEDPNSRIRKNIRRSYTPSEQEIIDTLNVTSLSKLEIGCVDWIYVNGERKILEINDAGTAMNTYNSKTNELIYDLSDNFIHAVKKHI